MSKPHRSTSIRGSIEIAGLVLAIGVWLAVVPGAQVLDRVLALVGGNTITLSDVNAAITFGLVPLPADPRQQTQAALDALVARQLQLSEVDRYLPPEPAPSDVDARLAQVRARFASPEAFEKALQDTGLTVATLRGHVRDDVRIESYRQQRFGAGYQPSDDEVLAYYRSHQSEFTRDGTVRPYPEVRDEARQAFIQARTANLVRDWIAGLRRRVDVTILSK